ncbi:hypothetical protein CEXT_454181 [Caerostris extrusa]|uniref:Uncharacterized protein n=1 Tax=Caerostris extrusa TaxID=172846 RepID=A0AAV4WTZ4_CAEEX|nr:hypothetical protein CEXT_454181 [Caerostris extrusa]
MTSKSKELDACQIEHQGPHTPPRDIVCFVHLQQKGHDGTQCPLHCVFPLLLNCSVKAKYFFPSSLVELPSGPPWVRTQNNTKSRDAKSFIIRVVIRKQVRDRVRKLSG